MEENGIKMTKHGLSEKEKELAQMLMAECKSTRDILETMKRLFAGTIEQMLEAEMDEHLGYTNNKKRLMQEVCKCIHWY